MTWKPLDNEPFPEASKKEEEVDFAEYDSEGEGFEDFDGEETEEDKNYDGVDDAIEDVNFSQLIGKSSFKKAFPKAKTKVKALSKKKKATYKRKTIKPIKNVGVQHKAFIDSKGRRAIAKVLIPRNKKTIVEHVGKFITDNSFDDYKDIRYYDGHKLKQILIEINNTSDIDFNFELFSPSMPLDYLYSTRLNLNDKIKIAGADYVSYTDLCYNLLANPLYIYNAQLQFSGTTPTIQRNQSFIIKNKNSQGELKIAPLSIPLYIDNYQIESNNIMVYNFQKAINRPMIADGMDVIQYRVLAGNSVSFCFYCRQILLKKFLYQDARKSKELI